MQLWQANSLTAGTWLNDSLAHDLFTRETTSETWAQFASSATSGYHLAVRSDGTLWTCGLSSNLGFGAGVNQFGTDTDWVKVETGSAHAVGIKADGSLWGWGTGSQGELGGVPTTTVPTLIDAGPWKDVACGLSYTLAVKADGTLWATGDGADGKTGLGSTADVFSLTQIGTATNWASVYAGYKHSAALTDDGALWTWGDNASGQVGNGSTADRTTPYQVPGTWKSVALSNHSTAQHTSAVKSDGTLWGWGYGLNGQIGDGTANLTNTTPRQAGADSDWEKVAIPYGSTTALKSDGTVWSTGNYAPRGLGPIAQVNVFTQVDVGAGWTDIQASYNCMFLLLDVVPAIFWTNLRGQREVA